MNFKLCCNQQILILAEKMLLKLLHSASQSNTPHDLKIVKNLTPEPGGKFCRYIRSDFLMKNIMHSENCSNEINFYQIFCKKFE